MSSSLSDSRENILDRFDDAWNGTTTPSIEDFMPPAGSPGHLPVLVELVKIDMERRCKRGERVRLEERYLPRFPELDAAPAQLFDLVIHEYTLRRHEPGLSSEEYLARWPRFREELSRRLLTNPPASQETFQTIPPPANPPAPNQDDELATVPPVTNRAPSPTTMGHYELVHELGRGGMGVVYRALDRQRGRQVALKMIQGMNAEALYRFKQEFRLRADLHHPNLVSLYELIAEDGCWFFTMELVEGSDFLRYVRAGTDAIAPAISAPLATPEQFQRLRHSLRQLAEGVEALHAAGRLHRDLKPSNVMVTRAGRVVLLDFGLMARLNTKQLHESTERHLLGTVAYMSPEQARSEPLSPASDWYSVGVMLYEALAGRLPFDGSVYRILSDKQQVDPPPPRTLAPSIPEDLDALCLALLSRDPAARPGGHDCLRGAGDHSTASAPVIEIRAADVALVGREAPLAALADAYAASRKRRTVALFLSGSSGIGKSSLLQKFLDQLRAEGEAVVLTGHCYEQESVPYKAFDGVIDALSRFLRRLSPLEVQALLPRDVASLRRVFPMLRRVDALLAVPQGHEAPDPQEVRQRAFAALRELLARLADRKPVVVCIDDLQWGDADSAALLTELVRPPDAPRFLFMGCHRSEEIASPFLTALAESNRLLWSEVDRREVTLDPLPIEEVEKLAEQLLADGASDPACASVIAREAGGNPFFVHELVRHVRAETGHALLEGAIDLEKVLWERMERLPAEARELLAVVAIAARPLPQNVACRAAGLAQGRIEELMLLRSQRLARGTGMSGDDLLVTYHDRIREAFRVRLSAEHTRLLHSRLAESLEAWGSADAEWLATHWEHAGERRRAGEYYGRAADQAAETLAFDNAADLYRRALQMEAHDADMRRLLQRKLGDALANAGRGTEAAKIYLAASEEDTSIETLELHRLAAEQFLRSGRIDEGLFVLRTILDRVGLKLPKRKWQVILELLCQRTLLWLRGVGFHQRHLNEISLQDINRIDVCWAAALGLSLVDPFSAVGFHTRHLLLALRAGDAYRVARGLAMEVGYSALPGRRMRCWAEKLLSSALTLAEQTNNPHAFGLTHLWGGCAAWLVGEWQKVRGLTERAEEIFRGQCIGVAWELASTHTFLFASLIWLGELKEHTRRFPALLQEAQKRGDQFAITTLPLLTYAYVTTLAADKPDLARSELSQAVEGWTCHGYHLQHFWALYGELETDLYCGSSREAWRSFQDQWPSITRSMLLRVQTIRLFTLHLRARIALALVFNRENEGAFHHGRRSLLKSATTDARLMEREKMPWGNALARLLRAGIATYQSDNAKVKQFLSGAMTSLESVNMQLYAAAARRRLGQLIGGDEGKALVTEADAWMTTQGVRNPVRMTAVYAPGFDDP